MATNNIKTLDTLQSQLVGQVDDYNKALANKDLTVMNALESAIKDTEAEYAEMKALAVYRSLYVEGNPVETIKAAVVQYGYEILGHHDKKEDDVILEREVIAKSRQIDLLKMCKYLSLPIHWQYTVEKLNQIMTLRAAQELKVPVETVATTYFMEEQAKSIDLGKTPTSNTALCKAIQQVIDEILFEDDGGKNKFKANNHDVAYILMLYTKKGKATLSVATAKHDFMRRIIMDVIHRIVTDKQYGLEYKKVKEGK